MTAVHLLDEVALAHPFWRIFELFRDRPYSFLLDSAGEDPHREDDRFSFMGADPFATFEAKRVPGDGPHRARIVVRAGGATTRDEVVDDPFDALRRLMAEHAPPPGAITERPVPFLAGAVGYFGYEAGMFSERLPDNGADDLGHPDIAFALFDSVLATDHRTGVTYLSTVARDEQAANEHRTRLEEIAEFEPQPPQRPGRAKPPTVTSHFDRASYAQAVEACREHIAAGDAYEICLTHRLEAPFSGDPWRLYRQLRRISPSPFAAYLNAPGAQVVCSSPERFLRLDDRGIVESRPIKGTRARGATREEDDALREALQHSDKDRAENMMIVDLVRNDLGRVCEYGSVEVADLMRVEPYATLFQLTSVIRGKLARGRDALDLVKAAFPGGSMTGAPKIEAMKIIDGLEPVKRGIYSGSIGYLDFAGPIDLNIVIRTLLIQDGRALYNVGGAVVHESDPEAEYDETMDKARALERALSASAES